MKNESQKSASDIRDGGGSLETLEHLLKLAEALPGNMDKVASLRQLVDASRQCGEVKPCTPDQAVATIDSIKKYFLLRAHDDLQKCFIALGIMRSKLYRVAGSVGDFAHGVGVAEQTFRNWAHRAEVAEVVVLEEPTLALPSAVHHIDLIRRLPREHWVPCWSQFLAKPTAKLLAGKTMFQRFVDEYRRINGLPDEKPSQPSSDEVKSPGLECLDETLDPSVISEWQKILPGSSPCRESIVGSLCTCVGEAAVNSLQNGKKLVATLQTQSPEDYELFIYFALLCLQLSANRMPGTPIESRSS